MKLTRWNKLRTLGTVFVMGAAHVNLSVWAAPKIMPLPTVRESLPLMAPEHKTALFETSSVIDPARVWLVDADLAQAGQYVAVQVFRRIAQPTVELIQAGGQGSLVSPENVRLLRTIIGEARDRYGAQTLLPEQTYELYFKSLSLIDRDLVDQIKNEQVSLGILPAWDTPTTPRPRITRDIMYPLELEIGQYSDADLERAEFGRDKTYTLSSIFVFLLDLHVIFRDLPGGLKTAGDLLTDAQESYRSRILHTGASLGKTSWDMLLEAIRNRVVIYGLATTFNHVTWLMGYGSHPQRMLRTWAETGIFPNWTPRSRSAERYARSIENRMNLNPRIRWWTAYVPAGQVGKIGNALQKRYHFRKVERQALNPQAAYEVSPASHP